MTASPETPPSPAYPPAGAPGYPPAPQQGKKLSASWTGVLMALGAIVAAVGSFLPFEKLVARQDGAILGTYQLTGLGGEKATGQLSADFFTPGGAGKAVLGAAVVLLVLGVLILAGKGRLWTSIVGLVVGLIALALALASLAAPSSDAKDLTKTASEGITVDGLTKMGAPIAAIGIGIAALAALLALVIRKRRTA